MVKRSTAFLLLFLGLILGGASVWAYYTYSVNPKFAADTKTQVNAERDAIEMQKSKVISGTVANLGANQLLIVSTTNRGFTVVFDDKTQFTHIDAGSQEKPITAANITLGSKITIVSDAPITDGVTIHAVKITQN